MKATQHLVLWRQRVSAYNKRFNSLASDMTEDGRSRRARERLGLQLPVRVTCRETKELEWAEVTRLLDVTPFGARFILSRPTEEGRLLHLSMPLPRPLRCYDFTEEQYRIWALVRRVKPLEASATETLPRFEVGAAFTGNRAPASFQRDPATRYMVAPPGDTGIWNINEPQEAPHRYVPPDEPRPETRVNMPIDMTVEVFDSKGKVTMSEETVTENISRRGAAIFSALQIERGRFVRLTSRSFGISVVAAVRARRMGTDGIPRLHLEFIDRQFPLEGVG